MPTFTSLACELCGYPITGPGICPNCNKEVQGVIQRFSDRIGTNGGISIWALLFTFTVGALVGAPLLEAIRKGARKIESK